MILTGWYTKKSDIQTCTPNGNIQYHPSYITSKWNLIKPLIKLLIYFQVQKGTGKYVKKHHKIIISKIQTMAN